MIKLLERLTAMLKWDASSTQNQISGSLDDLLNAAQQAQYSEQYDEALKLLDQATEQIGTHPDSITLSVDLTLNRADIFIAQRDYQKAITLLDNLIDEARQREHRTPVAYGLCSKGVILQQQERLPEARNLFDEASHIARNAGAEGAEGRAIGHLGTVYLQEGNAAYAIHLLREALPLLQSSGDTMLIPDFMGHLGEALIQTGQKQEGRMVLIRALETAVTMKHRLFTRNLSRMLGEIAVGMRDYTAAQQYFQNILQLSESPLAASVANSQLLLNMSQVSMHSDEPEKAQEYIQQAARMAETLDNPELTAQIHAMRAMLQTPDSEPDNAIAHLEAALSVYDNEEKDDFYIDLLCRLAAHQPDPDQKRQHYEQALQAAQDASLLDSVAAVTTALGSVALRYEHDPQQAIDYWQDAIRYYTDQSLYPELCQTYSQTAEAWMWLGQTKNALRDLEQALMHLNTLDDSAVRGNIMLRAARLYMIQGDMDTAESFYTDAISLAKQTEDEQAQVYSRGYYGVFLTLIGDTSPAQIELKAALALAETHQLTQMQAHLTDALAQITSLQSRYPEAEELHTSALSLLDAELDADTDPVLELFIKLHYARTLSRLNREAEALDLLETVISTGRDLHHAPLVTEALLTKAAITLPEHPADAATLLDEARSLVNHMQHRRLQAMLHTINSQYLAQMDQVDAATDAWLDATQLYKKMRMPLPDVTWLNMPD